MPSHHVRWLLLAAACGSSTSDDPRASDGGRPIDAAAPSQDGEPGAQDTAAVTASSFPAGIACDSEQVATIEITNAGRTTWTRDGGYKLGAVDDSDPFRTTEPRIWLDDGIEVPPGGSHVFHIPLRAPAVAGTYTSDWQMVKEGVHWFGAIASQTIEVTCAANRTPDPPPGQRLPLPDVLPIIQEVHDRDPSLIAQSCLDEGGDFGFLDAVVDRLRQDDTRWGYNWKRGVVGEPSQDVIDYHHGAGPDEGSIDVYIIDIIVGHCGPDPGPVFNDVTDETAQGGSIGKWTGRGRF